MDPVVRIKFRVKRKTNLSPTSDGNNFILHGRKNLCFSFSLRKVRGNERS